MSLIGSMQTGRRSQLVQSTKNWQLIAELAKECDSVDPIDWGQLNISEEEAFNLMAMHMAELEDNVLTLKATCVKLMVENFVLNLKLLGRK